MPPFETRNGDHHREIDPAFLCRNKIVIDTGSLLEESARTAFVEKLLPQLVACGAKAFVLGRTIDFLESRRTSSSLNDRRKAEEALAILRMLQERDRLLDLGDSYPISGDPFATSTLYTDFFIKFQMKDELCLITQNEGLALQVIKNSRSGAFKKIKPVSAVYVDKEKFNNWAPKLLERAGHRFGPNRGTEDLELQISQSFKVVADTCSLMLADRETGEPKGKLFFTDRLLPLLHEHKNKLIIPERVFREVEKHVTSDAPKLKLDAQAAQKALEMFAAEGLLIRGEDEHEVEGVGKNFADPVFVSLAIRFQSQFDLCFITQDEKLATTLLDNRVLSSGKKFLVTFITQSSSRLALWEYKLADNKNKETNTFPASGRTHENSRNRKNHKTAPSLRAKPRPNESNANSDKAKLAGHGPTSDNASPHPKQRKQIEPFALATQVQFADTTPIAVASLPVVGSTVLGQISGAVQLTEELAAGGEGSVYRTNFPGLVCKIYHKECLTRARQQKLELMVSREVSIRGVCWPTELATTTDGEFVGYLMPEAEGKILKTSVFAKPLLGKTFPNWTREHLTQLAITILLTIERLHQHNIFIGDINPQNILVRDEKAISIIDADSFQVEGIPCPVGTDTFTPPERQGQNFAEFLRTPNDELFAVTTLLFMVLFPGKAPYSSQGGGDIAENIRNQRFPYGKNADSRPPDGPWQFIWSHLHPQLKKDFSAVFSDGKRIPIEDLNNHLKRSLKEIREGKSSNELFPEKPWQREGDTVTVRCNDCPPDKAEHQITTFEADKLQADGRPFLCKNCRSYRKMDRLESTRVVDCQSRISPHCTGHFTIKINKLDDLKANGKEPWCTSCTDMQKERWAQARAYRKSGNSYCFVATAAYQSQWAPEVVLLRAYRDHVLAVTSPGRVFITTYYYVGPALAAVVKALPILRPLVRRVLDRFVKRLSLKHPELEPYGEELHDRQ